MTIDAQIAALEPLGERLIVLLAGYKQPKQFVDYRFKGRVMNPARLEKLAVRLEELAATARRMKK